MFFFFRFAVSIYIYRHTFSVTLILCKHILETKNTYTFYFLVMFARSAASISALKSSVSRAVCSQPVAELDKLGKGGKQFQRLH